MGCDVSGRHRTIHIGIVRIAITVVIQAVGAGCFRDLGWASRGTGVNRGAAGTGKFSQITADPDTAGGGVSIPCLTRSIHSGRITVAVRSIAQFRGARVDVYVTVIAVIAFLYISGRRCAILYAEIGITKAVPVSILVIGAAAEFSGHHRPGSTD
jgi:hypothetical protein